MLGDEAILENGNLSQADTEPTDLGNYGTFNFGTIYRIPFPTLQILAERAKGSANEAFVYQLKTEHRGRDLGKFPLEFQLYQKNSFVGIAASYTESDMTEEHKNFVQKLKTPILAVSVMDEKGRRIGNEKWSFGVSDYFGTMDFEIEQLISNALIIQLLEQPSDLQLKICITGHWIEFPKLSSNIESESDEDDDDENEHEINEQGDAPSYCQSKIMNSGVLIPYNVDGGFKDKFPNFLNETMFSSVLHNGTIRGNYPDAFFKAQDGNTFFVMPTHRVFVAAHSDVFSNMLTSSDMLTLAGYNISVPLMAALQDFIYTGEVKSTDFKVLLTLGKMANDFQIVGLNDRCIRQAILKLSKAETEQYYDYYRLSKQLNSPDLLKMAVDVYERNRNSINKSKSTEDLGSDIPNDQIEAELDGLSLSFDCGLDMTKVVHNQYKEVEAMELSTVTKFTFGTIIKIPESICEDLLNEMQILEPILEDSVILDFELPLGQPAGINEALNLQIYRVKNSYDLHLRSSPISEASALPALVVTIYNGSGRIANQLHVESKALTVETNATTTAGSNSQFYQAESFITGEMLRSKQLLDEMDEIVIGVSICDSKNQRKSQELSGLTKIEMDSIRTRLQGQYGNAQFSDAMLTVVSFENKSILWTLPVHRAIMAAFSTVWEMTFWKSKQIEICTKDYSLACIQNIIRYIYGGNLPSLTVEEASELKRAAEEFQVKGLMDFPVNMLASTS